MTESAISAQAAEGTQPPAGTAEVPVTDAGDVQSTQPEMNLDELKRVVSDLRKENAGHRTRLKKFEADAAEAEAAKLSDLERATKERDALSMKLTEAERQMTRMRVEATVTTVASKAGFVNPADAFSFIDSGSIEIGEDGTPSNVETLVAELAKSRPYLLASAAPARTTGSFDTGNGARPSAPKTYTRDQLRDPAFFAANKADILAAQAEGRIRN